MARTNDDRFAGRVALVTGGASGIGAAIAGRLHSEGARVGSIDISGTPPGGVLALVADVSDSAQIAAALARTEAELGPVDVLVCAAGIPGASLSTVDVSDEEWRRVMSIDADGTASLTGERGLRPGHRLPARLAPTRSGNDAFGPPARRRDARRRA